jgi:hypothetical protein
MRLGSSPRAEDAGRIRRIAEKRRKRNGRQDGAAVAMTASRDG